MDAYYEAIFYVRYYLDTYPFLIPLGIIGVWRWSVWLLKKISALFYKPEKNDFTSRVSIITPVYNENPHVFYKALLSWVKNNPSEIVAVIDYSDRKCIEVFKEFAKSFQGAKLLITKTPGKRQALADGIKTAREKIVALVDSDTIWEESVIKNALPPFKDEKVAGVGTYQNVLRPKTLAQRLFDTQLDLRYADEFPFLSAWGDALVCLSGRTVFYRREIILPLIPDLVNETFWGEKVISGDDKRLTYLVLANGWKVAYQGNSRVYTPGMEDFSSYFKQRVRWARNSLRADLRAMWQGWTFRHPALAFFQVDKVFQAFVTMLSPIYFFVSVFSGLWFPAVVIFVWWFVSRAVKIYPHLKRRPQDIAILPFFVPYTFLTAIIKIYTLFTLNTQGWITRWDKSRLPQLKFIKELPAYAATMSLIFFLTGGVYFYKDYIYLKPLVQKQKLISETLPNLQNLSVSHIKNTGVQEKELLVKKYEIENGESLGIVAERNGVSVLDILNSNISRLTNWNSIDPGFVVNVPGKDVTVASSNKFNYERIYPDTLQISYDVETNTIVVSGRGEKLTLNDIRSNVGEEYLQEVEPEIWQLKANLYLRSGTTLVLDKNEVKWLRLISNETNFATIFGYNANILVDGVKITSWDEEKGDFDKNIKDGRSFILVKDGSRMDLQDSELSYLGFPRTPEMKFSPYGVSWRISNGKLGKALLTGEITNSKFHHNYFGAYTFGATGMIWRGNEFFENIRYGLDPHDDSNGFLIENNKFYNNGSHGLILSKRCINNIIRNNVSYNNKLHGIMLHEKSNNNLIENNITYGNRDGIAVWHSSSNVIRNNIIHGNERGIRLNVSSNENIIENNKIFGSSDYGIYFYDEAKNNLVLNNIIRNNSAGIYIKSNENQISKNTIEKNEIGIYFLEKAEKNKVIDNKIIYNISYGIYTKTQDREKNYLKGNEMIKNLENTFVR